jgi:hypothetical protein
METFLNFMEEASELVLTTPFAIPVAVACFVGACWVVVEMLTKKQEAA